MSTSSSVHPNLLLPLPSSAPAVKRAGLAALFLALLALSPLGVAAQPLDRVEAESAASLPPHPQPIRLRSRTFTPPSGIDPAVIRHAEAARAEGASSVLLVVQLRGIPDQRVWRRLQAEGLDRVAYLGEGNWFVRAPLAGSLPRRLGQALYLADIAAITVLQPSDKASPRLAAAGPEPWREQAGETSRDLRWAYDSSGDYLRVVVQFFPGTPQSEMQQVVDAVHCGTAPPVTLSKTLRALEIHPAALDGLLAVEAVYSVDLGPLPKLPLLDDARWITGVDDLQQINFASIPPGYSLSGRGVTLANDEGLDTASDDFWDHDLLGNRTTPRWDPSCPAEDSTNGHGTMTAGIALGNGFLSVRQGGTPRQWRGVAPEATFACFGTNEDVSNHSYTMRTYGEYNSYAAMVDSQIRGDDGGDQRPQIWAVANQGITSQGPDYGPKAGYYSVLAPAKNPIVVANISARTLGWMQSSLGPTFDGRIKPDLSAPGSQELFPADKKQLLFDLDSIEVVQGSTSLLWSFDGAGSWQGGWAENSQLGMQNTGPVTQLDEAGVKALRVPLKAPPWTSFRPIVGTLKAPDGTPLHIAGTSADQVRLRYRLESDLAWQPTSIVLRWMVYPNGPTNQITFEATADGAWHPVVIPVGQANGWAGVAGIGYLYLLFPGNPMPATGLGGGLIAAGGSSAAAPVVTGAVALLMEQLTRPPFSVQLGAHGPSPFWQDAPGSGVPLPSTFKALLVQGAQDLAYVPRASDPDNPDTHAPTVYHQGPDLATGFGMIDVAESSRILAAHTAARPFIVERSLQPKQSHTYTIDVPPSPRGPLKVTLAWDDPAASTLADETASTLINRNRLTLVAPGGTVHYPYSIDQPYSPGDESQYPSVSEPQPITPEDIHPARQDRPNDLDNVQQVYVESPQPGPWQVKVRAYNLGAPPQSYSLILGTPALPATHLSGGKVVFSSDRVNPPQLFVQQVGATPSTTQPPQQVTTGPFAARHPVWSRNGKYISYITADVIVGPETSNSIDDLMVITEQGTTLLLRVTAAHLVSGARGLGYQQWSDDGRRMVLTYWNTFDKRGLALVEFSQPYGFAGRTVRVLVLPPGNPGSSGLNAGEAVFSRDGNFIYFTADSSQAPSQVFCIPVAGGDPEPVYGNGFPMRRAFAPSLSPDGTRLNYNSELWKEDPVHYQDEELLQVGLLTGVIQQLTYEPGNQYGWFAKNGAGEMVVRSNSAPSAQSDLFLEENGVRVKLNTGISSSSREEGPDWWKTPCGGSPVLWSGDEPAGCKLAIWGREQKSLCGSWVVLASSGHGACKICVDPTWATPILNGASVPLTEGLDPQTATPADLPCR
ncbi:MAG: S8 family serine peptidase [Thermoanaerobaculia bacterium]